MLHSLSDAADTKQRKGLRSSAVPGVPPRVEKCAGGLG